MMTATDDLFEVERQALDVGIGEIDEFAGHHVGQAVAAGDAVADFQHLADLAGFDLSVELGDLLAQ